MKKTCLAWIGLCCLILISNAAVSQANMQLAQCQGISDLVFVAHMDDDLLFMNPDIESTIMAQGCLKVVYLTASDRGEGESYMLGRERGVQAAYAHLAKVANDWTATESIYGSRRLASFTLNKHPNITLLQMRIKDPWLGKGWGSLTPLSRTESIAGQISESLGPYVEIYDRDDMVATLAAIIESTQPSTIRYMDDSITTAYTALCWRCAGHDHPDHIASAKIVRDAMSLAGGVYAKTSYLTYPSQERDSNLTQQETDNKTSAFLEYARHDYRYCPVPEQCQGPAGPEAAWVSRIYYVSNENTPVVILPDPIDDYLLFTIGERNQAANVWQKKSKHWSTLGGRAPDAGVAFTLPSGTNGILMRDANGRLWFKMQKSNQVWDSWQALDGPPLLQLPSLTSQGPIAAIGMGNDFRFYYAQYVDTDKQWSGWDVLPELPRALPSAAMARNRDGKLMVFANDANGKLWFNTQDPSLKWLHWQVIDGVQTDGGLLAMLGTNDLINLYLRDQKTGYMLHITQAQPDNAANIWNTPVDLGLPYIGVPAAAIDEHGEIIVAALERKAGPVWISDNGQAQQLPLAFSSTPSLRLINGVIHMAARASTAAQEYVVMMRSNGAWTAPQVISPLPLNGGSAFN